jgi:alpha-galactosidase
MKKHISLFSFLLWLLPASPFVVADTQATEKAAIHSWAEAAFAGRVKPSPPQSNLLLSLKPGAFARGNIQGHAFLVAGRSFDDGIAMRAPGEITIEVPAGARRFDAVVGVDSNDIGYYSNAGRGSVVAFVVAGGKELYRSPILREGVPGIPVAVELHGATEFSIRLASVGVKPATYQPEWDQADWGEAKVTLANGQIQSLSELPIGPLPHEDSTNPPFSFQFGKKSSATLLPAWTVKREEHRLDSERTQYRLDYTDPSSGFEVRCMAILYDDFPAVEWTLYLKNGSSSPSPLIETLKPLDTEFQRGSESRIAVHHSRGSMAGATDFQPLIDNLAPGGSLHFSSKGGRPTDGDMPYFNLAWPHRGIIAALGWPGQWDFTITREHQQNVRLTGGQSTTHFQLMPSEEVRTPLVVIEFWSGDWIDGQNNWRRWMIQHNLPRPGGRLPPPQIAASRAHFTIEMQECSINGSLSITGGWMPDGIRTRRIGRGWAPGR